jgi:hexosaminidase
MRFYTAQNINEKFTMNKVIKFNIRTQVIIMLAICIGSYASYAQNAPSIIPLPASISMHSGNFLIDANTTIRFAATEKDLQPAVQWFTASIHEITGIPLKQDAASGKVIELLKDTKKVPATDAYELTVTPEKITITSGTYGGFFYAMQTLLQTLPAIRTNALPQIPCMMVTDKPQFGWRGMHLDVSRHFFGPEVIKTYIDLMATYKFNTFHWHLVDDQGWRIEIKKYPKLTGTSAWRADKNHLVWGERPQAKPGEPATYGGYYTQQQIKEIIEYAAQRNITIVPEIEMPGHVASAIAAYPHLSCNQLPQLPLTGGNYSNISSNYCAGNDSVFSFLQDVLDEVIALFPSKFIHIGGDEVDKGPWKKCAKCQQRMQNEKLQNEEELQSYFIKRMEKYLGTKGRSMIGWDEILEGGLAPEATVMSWRGEAGGIEAAKMNHDVVMTPGHPLYFDHYQAGPAGEPTAIGGMNTLKNVYDYEPIPAALPAEKSKYVLGAQANLWTEYITTASQLEYMALPRMLALAEVLWLPRDKKNWNDFSQRIQAHYRTFEQKGLNYCTGNYSVLITPHAENGALKASLSTEIADAYMVFTTDGTEPTTQSERYITPIDIHTSMTLKASVVQYGRVRGAEAAKQHFTQHAAIGKPVSYVHPISRQYQANGPNSLTDGIRGTYTAGKYWHGISGRDMVATVDLGKSTTINSLSIGCLHKYTDWIFLPQSVSFEISEDGVLYREIGQIKNDIPIDTKQTIYDFRVAAPAGTQARYIRVSAKNNLCPSGHPGAGKAGWIFADELIVM